MSLPPTTHTQRHIQRWVWGGSSPSYRWESHGAPTNLRRKNEGRKAGEGRKTGETLLRLNPTSTTATTHTRTHFSTMYKEEGEEKKKEGVDEGKKR